MAKLNDEIAEALYKYMDSLKNPYGWVHSGEDFLPANVCCDYAGMRGFINGMSAEIERVIKCKDKP